MVERPLFEIFRDRLFGRRRIFRPQVTDLPVECLKETYADLPVFPISLMPGEERQINNLEIRVNRSFRWLGIVEIQIREPKDKQDGFRKLRLDDVYVRNGAIHLGYDGIIAVKDIRPRGRINFSMAMAPDIDVHSKEHRSQRQRIRTAESKEAA